MAFLHPAELAATEPVAASTPPGQTRRLACTVVSDPAALDGLAPAWAELLERSSDNQAMLSPTWLLPWWRIYSAGRKLRIAVLRDGDRLVGLAPLLARRCWIRHCLPFRRLEALGADVDQGDGVGSEYLGVIAERGSEAAVADAVVAGITSGQFGAWDEVVLPAMAGDGPMPDLLTTAFRRAGYHAECVPAGAALHIPLPESWDAYLKSLSANARYFVRRCLRDFEKWAGGPPHIERVTNAAELAEGKRVLTAQHGERWAHTGQAGAFQSPRFTAFHDAVLPELQRQNALQLGWLTAHGEPVAALYNIVWNRRVLVYQSGRKPDTPRDVRPGIVLHALAIRAAIEAGYQEYDFLGGEAQYKAQLSLARRPLVQVRAVRPSLVEAGRRLVEGAIALSRPIRRAAGSIRRRSSKHRQA